MIAKALIAGLFATLCHAQNIAVVKNAPFSATATTQVTQTLADGNRIVRTTTARIARDSEGRTRREQKPVTFIVDPVASATYVIDAGSRLVRRTPAPKQENAAQAAVSAKSEPLGSQAFEGTQADGTRMVRTLAAGEANNEQPLEIAVESWYSSTLQTTVMSKTTDPRIGETVYKLSEIQLGEPDRALFEIPQDYVIRDEIIAPARR